MPTFRRLLEKHPDATMKWFARGKLWESPEAARRDADASTGRPETGRPARGRNWRPGGDHRDPRQPFIDAKKARNLDRRKTRFERQQRGNPRLSPPAAGEAEAERVRREERPQWIKPSPDQAARAPKGRATFPREDSRHERPRDPRASSGKEQPRWPKGGGWKPKAGERPPGASRDTTRGPASNGPRPGGGPSGKGPLARTSGRPPFKRPPSSEGDDRTKPGPRPSRPGTRPSRRDDSRPADRRRR